MTAIVYKYMHLRISVSNWVSQIAVYVEVETDADFTTFTIYRRLLKSLNKHVLQGLLPLRRTCCVLILSPLAVCYRKRDRENFCYVNFVRRSIFYSSCMRSTRPRIFTAGYKGTCPPRGRFKFPGSRGNSHSKSAVLFPRVKAAPKTSGMSVSSFYDGYVPPR